MTKKVGVTPSVVAPGNSNPNDATDEKQAPIYGVEINNSRQPRRICFHSILMIT